VKSFDSVKKEIREDMVQELLIDEIYKLIDEVDEFFAVGGALEDAQEQFDLSIESFDNITRFGQDSAGENTINPAFGPDAQTVLQSAYELDEGTTGPAFELSDARFVVVNNAGITPKTYTPFEEVKDQIKTQWIADQKSLSNRMATTELQKEKADIGIDDIAKEKGKSFKTISTIKRDDETSPLSPSARNSIFGAKTGEHFLIEIRDGVALAEVTKVTKPSQASDTQKEELLSTTQKEMQNELLALYMKELLKDHPAKVNTRLLEQIYGEQESESF